MYTYQSIFKDLHINACQQVHMWAVRINKFVTSGSYLTARENEVELLTTIFYSLPVVSVEKFHEKSVCNEIDGVQLRFVQIQHLKTVQ